MMGDFKKEKVDKLYGGHMGNIKIIFFVFILCIYIHILKKVRIFSFSLNDVRIYGEK